MKLSKKILVGSSAALSSIAILAAPVSALTNTADIADGAVTSAKIAGGAVTTAQLSANAVRTSNIVNGAVQSADISNGTIVNSDISATAAIDGSKVVPVFGSSVSISGKDLTLANGESIANSTDGKLQVTGSLVQQKGSALASAATLTLGQGNIFHVTGTTTVTDMTVASSDAGRVVTLIFDGSLTFTDGNNLKLAGDLSATSNDTITLVCDGTSWFEVARSAN